MKKSEEARKEESEGELGGRGEGEWMQARNKLLALSMESAIEVEGREKGSNKFFGRPKLRLKRGTSLIPIEFLLSCMKFALDCMGSESKASDCNEGLQRGLSHTHAHSLLKRGRRQLRSLRQQQKQGTPSRTRLTNSALKHQRWRLVK